MSLFGIAKLVSDLSAELEATLYGSELSRTIASPIEQLFFAAFVARQYSLYREFPLVIKPNEASDVLHEVGLHTQRKIIGQWPVDFLIDVRAPEKNILQIVVECDGHDFHERTKEQAMRDRSRDRQLQSMGYRIFRFTGAELYRDPLKCGDEVYSEVIKFIYEHLPTKEPR